MRILIWLALFPFCSALAQSPAPEAGVPPSDPRVESAFARLDLEYETEANGDYRLLFAVDSVRRQLVWVRPTTDAYRTLEMREVFAKVARFEDVISHDLALGLLAQNTNFAVGTWTIEDDAILFIARMPAEMTDEDLDSTISAVLFTADELEAVLTDGADEW